MTLLEKHQRFAALWRVVMPHIEEPTVQDSAQWSRYSPEEVERAICRTGRRFAPSKLLPTFAATEAYRYVSAVARAESEKNNAA
jgi:hypothetical protein